MTRWLPMSDACRPAHPSVAAPALPTSYTKQRRIGSFLTNGASQIVEYIQDADRFQWKFCVLDIDVSNPGINAVTRTLASVPTGVNVPSAVIR